MKNTLLLSDELKGEIELLNIIDDFEFFKQPPDENIPRAIVRKNDFLVPYDYGSGIIDKKQYVLRLSAACTANCEYCYIKAENKHSSPVFFYNISKIFKELDKICSENKNVYVNAGENSDSLAYDNISKQSNILHFLACKYPRSMFEMRTKLLKFNEGFFKLKPINNLIIAVTINPSDIIKSYEHGSASLEERIRIMKRLKNMGYNIALRIDPMIYSELFYELYDRLCKVLIKEFLKDDIFDIQIGCLRINKRLYKILKNKKSALLSEEIYQGDDGKFHYYIGIRKKMYDFVLKGLSYFNCSISLSNENKKCLNISGI